MTDNEIQYGGPFHLEITYDVHVCKQLLTMNY